MEVNNYPLVSIVTVNYNGKRFLTNLFNSIRDLDYPSDRIQTILVDNSSIDGSTELVRQKFPWVDILSLDKNYGYAGGNNAGFKRSEGEYIALVNNDCIVNKGWLKRMVETAIIEDTSSKIGAVCSKVLFYYDYIPVRFDFENNSGKVYLEINRITADGIPGDNKGFLGYIKLLDGFSRSTVSDYTRGSSLNVSPGARMALPVLEHSDHILVECSLSSGEETNLGIMIDNFSTEKSHREGPAVELFNGLIGADNKIVNLKIDKNYHAFKKSLINSCGLEVNEKFYARDRGSNSWDENQFDRVEEVFSPSGSSLLVNRKMLEETGYFDDSFFTYYEDIDLFWRARLGGWKHYFSPYSVARHHHCGTGEEWSYSFSYHVIRNRLLAIFKCGWFTKFTGCYFAFVVSVFSNTFFYTLSFIRGRVQNRPDIRARLRVFFELFYLLPKNLIKRSRIRSNTSISDREIKKWTLDF